MESDRSGITKRVLRPAGRAAFIALLWLPLVTACAADDSTSAEPAISGYPDRIDLSTLTLPLDPYERSSQQQTATANALATLSTRCLARFGFRIEVPSAPGGRGEGHVRRYGRVILEDAKRYGYRPAPDSGIANRRREPELPPAAYAVMHGEVSTSGGQDVPKGGCLAEAKRQLRVRDDAAEAAVQKLVGEAAKLTERDSRVQTAFAEWSSCMAAAGFTYGDPWQANDDPRWQETQAASVAEIAVATADVSCKEKVRLVPLWATVEAAYQRDLMERRSEELRAAKDALDAEVRAAAEVLAGGR